MAQSLNLKITGLHTFANDLSGCPEGSLSQADNIVVDRDSIAEPRRGFDVLRHGSAVKSTFTGIATKQFFFQNKKILHTNDNKLWYHDVTTGWNNLSSSFAQPTTHVKVRSAQANKNLYLTTSLGVKKLDAYNAAPILAGTPPALTMFGVITGFTGFLAAGNSVAYRFVWGIKDANNNLVLGAPSARCIVKNTIATTTYTQLSLLISQGVTPNHFFQIYRSSQVAGTPDDELRLCYEGNPSAGDVVAGFINVDDIAPDVLLGASLYTNGSQQGSQSANIAIPLCQDMAVYRGSMFYLNTSEVYSAAIQLLGLGSPAGLVAGNTLIISGAGGATYTARAIKTSYTEFEISTAWSSIEENIAQTAINLCVSISSNPTSQHYAYYVSVVDGTPGKIVITSRSVAAAAYTVTVNNVTAWSVPTVTATNDAALNGVAYSKTDEPEAVPLANRFKVGDANRAIQRGLVLRDSLFVLKEGEGVYRIYGTDPSNFQCVLLDNTANIIAPESAVVMNNQIFAFTSQDMVTISETGVTIMSRPIELDLTSLISVNLQKLQDETFAVAYESQRAYYLFLITNAADTLPTQYYRYNTLTNAWTRGIMNVSCGGVDPVDDLLYLGDGTGSFLRKERKKLDETDHADYSYTGTISVVDGNNITIVGAHEVGEVVYQSDVCYGIVTAVNGNVVTVQGSGNALQLGSCDILIPIKTAIRWMPMTFQNPAINKQVREAQLLMRDDIAGFATVGFSSDVCYGPSEEIIWGVNNAAWGVGSYGGPGDGNPYGGIWGGGNRRRNIRVSVPRRQQRCSCLFVSFSQSWAYSKWALEGISLFGTNISERVNGGGS